MKKTIIALAAIFAVGAASAADLGSVGTTGSQVNVGYNYLDLDGAKASLNVATVGGQLNLGDKGSVALDVGAARADAFGGDLTNEIVSLTYANGGKIGSIDVVGALSYTRYNALKSGPEALNLVSASTEASVTFGSLKPFVGYSLTHAFLTSNSASAGGFVNTASAGAYVSLTEKLSAKVGYQHVWQNGLDAKANGAVASLSYKF